MKDYFRLQFKMTNRKLSEFGFHPVLGYLLGLTSFILLSEYLFRKTELAKYLVVLTALGFLLKISEKSRSEFLQMVFGSAKFRQIRIVENLLICLPFGFVLIYHMAFLEALILFPTGTVSAFLSFGSGRSYSIPTPFSKQPFEFPVGFRKTFYLFPVAYFLAFLSISVSNFNLGIFAMLFIFLVSLTFYTQPENEYFVWNFAAKPSAFLWGKIKTASFYVTFLVVPVIIALCIFYPGQAHVLLWFALVGYLSLWMVILAKYSAYPNAMNLPEGIPMAFCFYFPLLLPLLILYFYSKSVKNLNVLLK